jgi:hypothetical protein
VHVVPPPPTQSQTEVEPTTVGAVMSLAGMVSACVQQPLFEDELEENDALGLPDPGTLEFELPPGEDELGFVLELELELDEVELELELEDELELELEDDPEVICTAYSGLPENSGSTYLARRLLVPSFCRSIPYTARFEKFASTTTPRVESRC